MPVLKQILDISPVPIMIWLVVVVSFIWLRAKYRDRKARPLFKDKPIRVGVVLTFLILVGYYLFQYIQQTKPDVVFPGDVIGIYICPLKNDTDRIIQQSIEENLKFEFADKYKNVKIFASRLKEPPPETDYERIAATRNISIFVAGTYSNIPNKEEYFLRIANMRLGAPQIQRYKCNVGDIQEVVENLVKQIQLIEANKYGAQNSQKYADLLSDLARQKYRNDEIARRLKQLELAMKASGNKPRIPDTKPKPMDKERKRWAFLIGINDYQGSDLPDLYYPVYDVLAMEQQLLRSGYNKDYLIRYTNEKANSDDLKEVFTMIKEGCGKDDSVLIYYSGHTIQGKDTAGNVTAYLCTHGFDSNRLAQTSISIDFIKSELDSVPSASVAMLIDSCFSGILSEPELSVRGVSVTAVRFEKRTPPIVFSPRPIVLEKNRGTNRSYLTAGKMNQQSVEGPRWGHGLFTYYILDGLKGGADLDGDHRIRVDELFGYIYPKVVWESNGQQTPQLISWGSASTTIAVLQPSNLK